MCLKINRLAKAHTKIKFTYHHYMYIHHRQLRGYSIEGRVLLVSSLNPVEYIPPLQSKRGR